MSTAQRQLENLTDALVDDIMAMPDEEVLLETLSQRFAALRAAAAGADEMRMMVSMIAGFDDFDGWTNDEGAYETLRSLIKWARKIKGTI